VRALIGTSRKYELQVVDKIRVCQYSGSDEVCPSSYTAGIRSAVLSQYVVEYLVPRNPCYSPVPSETASIKTYWGLWWVGRTRRRVADTRRRRGVGNTGVGRITSVGRGRVRIVGVGRRVGHTCARSHSTNKVHTRSSVVSRLPNQVFITLQ